MNLNHQESWSLIFGVVALMLTLVWLRIFPKRLADKANHWRFIVLRWFHALVWLLLAAAAFVARFEVLGGAHTAQPLAWLSLVAYLTFIVTLLTSKRAA
jgi:hypothetical protein